MYTDLQFKLGRMLHKYDIDYIDLAKRMGRCKSTVRRDAYVRGVTSRTLAMAYAYALDCEVNDILEHAPTVADWRQPCLPGCEL